MPDGPSSTRISPSRRHLLTGLAALPVSGCLSRAASSGEAPQPDQPDSTTAGTDASESPDHRSISISDTASIPSDANLSITASLPRKQITSDAPARLTVEVTNTGDRRVIDLTDREYCHLFNRGLGGSDPAGLWLYREQNTPDDRAKDRWIPDRNSTDTRAFITMACGKQAFEKNESIATTYEIWHDYVADGYFPPGTYRFDASIALWDSIEVESDPRVIDWWLELEVTAPGQEH